ncbi:beta-galactosidase [Dyadobacter sp. CY345]|uniref:GH39 family glycosyl hydrolase n=1 Tax=Dyadobacter sp. CY345 TaxID=2909335 RepID=UPI001F3F18F2|nr:beta-galactosidase [Dyadobacter sp. CY345]MCF2446753.1 beta-galactosidase [Dyadobacter sp. CY345]
MKYPILFIVIIALSSTFGFAQKIDTSANRVKTDFSIPLKRIGTIKPKKTSEINSSNWIIGCETLDRDLTDYEQYKEYLVPLGIKKLRMQAGWAKTEKIKNKYDWAWLDKIIDDAHQRGLQPWLETGYGNTLYEGGGGTNLSAGIPSSDQALKAWDKWVTALVERYKDKVTDWEVWNEPNFGDNEINKPEKVADLNIRTAEIIKRIQPEARISGLAMGHIDLKYADVFFKRIHDKGKMNLFDNMTYHDYVYNPDANYGKVAELRLVLDKYAPQVKLRQGENGSPSFGGGNRGAIGDYDWSEISQAKWNIRRMLGDLGHDIESSILGIIEMNYGATSGPITKMNVKGIIESDTSKRAIRPKIAYYAMQNVASVFDDQLVRIKDLEDTHNTNATIGQDEVRYNKGTDRSLAVYAYQHKNTKKQVFTIWNNEYIPTSSNATRNINFTILNGNFENPVYVDMLTGGVYEIPADQYSVKGNKYTLKNIAIYDSPVLIADKSLIIFK